MTYGSETRPLLVDVGFERAEMQLIRWMCGISLKDRRTNEELRRLVGVEPITTFIRSGRLKNGSKRHSLQAVELSQQTQAAVQIVANLPAPSNGVPIYRFWGMRTRWMAGAAAHKSG